MQDHKSNKHTLGNIEVTPNNRLARLNGPEKKAQLHTTARFISKEKSYSLVNLHKQLLGSLPAQSHGAEADCLALIRTTAVFGMEWLQWLQDNLYMISNC